MARAKPVPVQGWLVQRSQILCWLSLGWLLWSVATPCAAGFETGELLGTIVDAEGQALSQVEVTLAGAGSPQVLLSDTHGRFRFGDLPPGNYALQAIREGYTKALYKPVNIRLGRATSVKVQLSSLPDETIVVTSEPPEIALGDPSAPLRLAVSEVDSIPLGNDPWRVLTQAPGVLVARQTVGQEATLTVAGPGADLRQNAVAIDGVVVTDSTPLAPSQLYPLQEMTALEVVGGSDVRKAESGALINLVTRADRRERRGAISTHFADQDWQATPGIPVGDDLSEQQPNRVRKIFEFGGDLGGQVVRDHLWLWGAYGQQEVRREALGGLAEDLSLEHLAGNLQAQLGQNSLALSAYSGDREQSGREAGPDRTAESTLREVEPHRFLKLDDTFLVASAWLLTGRYYQLDYQAWRSPLGGLDQDIVLGEDGIWRGSYGVFHSGCSSTVTDLETSTLQRFGRVEHELLLGVNRRTANTSSAERWGSSSLLYLAGENFGTPFDLIRIVRPSNWQVEQSFFALWLQDSLRFDRLTLDLGFRYENQHGRNLGGEVEANPVFPDLLPALHYEGGSGGFAWNTLSPRLGLAYSWGDSQRTVLRASYASFVSRLIPELISRVSPLAPSAVTLGFTDLDGNSRIDDEDPVHVVDHQGVDLSPPNSSRTVSSNLTDPVLDPEHTDELRVGLERQLGSNMELRLEVVSRQLSDVMELRRLVRDESGTVRVARARDYALDSIYTGFLPDGQPFATPVYSLKPGITATGGNLLANGDRSQRYQAVILGFERRLSNRAMLRSHVTWSDWRWHLGSDFRQFDDPTDGALQGSPDAGVNLADNNGDIVAAQADGENRRLFLNSRWSFNLYGLYQVAPNHPWGFQCALNLSGRQGYPVPYSIVATAADRSLRQVQVTPKSDAFRLEDVYTVDLRLEKDVRLGPLRATLSLDGFNLLNAGYVLEREPQLNSPQANAARQTLSPRVFRLGVRLAVN